MAARRPLVRIGGEYRQLPSGDIVDSAYLAANLNAFAQLGGAGNKGFYFTGAGALALYDLTVFGRLVGGLADQAAGRALFGLGSAATREVTTSASDNTSERLWRTNDLVKQTGAKDVTVGSVLLVGAGGLMTSAPTLTSNDYDQDTDYCGFARNNNGSAAVNYPPQLGASNIPMAVLNVRFSSSYGWQLGVATQGSSPSAANLRMFVRNEVNGTWSDWAQVFNEGNVATYTNLSLASGFTWDSAGDAGTYHQPSYAKVGDTVRLRGKVTMTGTHASSAAVTNKTIATLPVGYRPFRRKVYSIFWDTDSPLFFGYCTIFVNTDGTIVLVTVTTQQTYPFTEGHILLDGLWFDLN
jgi:hypothetical protein